MNFIDLWKIPNNLHTTLKDWDGKMVTRFPPEPSGYLHIGHAKAAFINYVIAKKYHGKMIMRFDDTNPTKESTEYENAIRDDLLKLGIVADIESHSSDFFDQILSYADYLIQNNNAYVDDSPQELIAEGREKCIDSPNRSNSIAKNLEMWNGMKSGTKRDSCVRIKIDMKHKNAACRDPTIFRFMDEMHHNTGDKYKVYPTYDFACPIVDSLEGVTHVFRANEFADRDEQYEFIVDALEIRKPLLFSYGKVNFEGSVMGKRKIKELINNNVIAGWDDPRLLTIRGLFNRGMHVDALRQFVATLGFSKNTNNMTEDKLWITNKKLIDKIATRYSCVPKDNHKEFIIHKIKDNYEQFCDTKDILRFVKNQDLGKRPLQYSDRILISNDECNNFKDNEEITLMNWGNAFVNGNTLTLNLAGDFKTTEKKVPWISNSDNVIIQIDSYSGLYNPCIKTYFIGESSLININRGDYIQLMKMNYYMCVDIDKINKFIHLIELSC
ncbi:glutamyl-tRNA synthetase [Fadolivirus algeromassiliense]|jgi:glutamyl/glutaminyl-tRNA synthetase|uniref:Glutamyl-tRNA synthetase n=1 Tax=Fadolivirus FV1/VV64 TaxID=3070911 RepID=A0A7D3QW12_9VIRU|nr:glutamyl-tRNA synthetase [Fadolivirus algeromassiliense]QKF94126.1 glutamyl-tRNA synthetase [Fadolivirus FV1/VV64]